MSNQGEIPQQVLVVNCGSSSVKWKRFNRIADGVQEIDGGVVQNIGSELADYQKAWKGIVASLSNPNIAVIGHRVVHGGAQFSDSILLGEDVVAAIEECVPLAPLHNPANLAGIRAATAAFPGIPQVAVFDTAFHSRLPSRSREYAIDRETSRRHGIRRYGFHGTSHRYVAERSAAYFGRPLEELRLITCHLGNGASAAAIEYGRSVDTSMGMTPLEGLVMGTRSGDLDAGVVLRLCKELGVEEAEELLNRKSGLSGLSGLGNDLRDIEKAAAEGHEEARLAIGVFAHRVRKYIGAYAAVMGGVDAIVFTGGIGENSAPMRQRILQRLEFLGVRIDEDKNRDCELSKDVFDFSEDNARVRSLAVRTDEEKQIALEATAIAFQDSPQSSRTIPIAVSARHVHLDRATMDLLFGEGSELEVHKEISQPGQFASKQKVNVIGPRNRIDGVRILGPLRGKNQVEVSRTDEFRLGVDAPIRRSGQVEGSAPVILEGPKGKVHLKEGLICARRHIHMTRADAKEFGVADGDEVEIKIAGGPRDLTYGDVLVRVKDSYLLEMHIDTDEANAAELSRGAQGDLVYSSPDCDASASLVGRKIKTP